MADTEDDERTAVWTTWIAEEEVRTFGKRAERDEWENKTTVKEIMVAFSR